MITRFAYRLLYLAFCLLITGAPGQAAGLISAVAPLDGQTAAAQENNANAPKHPGTHGRFAKLERAAICTEDLAEITFQEYSADWTGWISQVAERWSFAMNKSVAAGKLQPCTTMWVEFTCKRDGSISGLRIHRSSGDDICDYVQLEALKACLPMPSFPAASRKQSISLLFVWDYSCSTRVARAARHRTSLLPAPQRLSITGGTM